VERIIVALSHGVVMRCALCLILLMASGCSKSPRGAAHAGQETNKVGKKDPRWDDLARKTVDPAIRQTVEPDSKVTIPEINRAAKAAIDAGCDDPLVANISQWTTSPGANSRRSPT
jgi:hypothetical protein